MRVAKRVTVMVAYYREPLRACAGYDSCCPHFRIHRYRRGEWQIIHVPTGLMKMSCPSLRIARLMCGALMGLDFDWRRPERWAAWQEKQKHLMRWFEETGQMSTQLV